MILYKDPISLWLVEMFNCFHEIDNWKEFLRFIHLNLIAILSNDQQLLYHSNSILLSHLQTCEKNECPLYQLKDETTMSIMSRFKLGNEEHSFKKMKLLQMIYNILVYVAKKFFF